MILIGLDDTDVLESRGTGHLARDIAAQLSASYDLLGVTRHQLLLDPRVPCTKNNSCSAILLDGCQEPDLDELLRQVKTLILADFQVGSDPGLCIATVPMTAAIVDFGRRAQQEIVTQDRARALAEQHQIRLLGWAVTREASSERWRRWDWRPVATTGAMCWSGVLAH